MLIEIFLCLNNSFSHLGASATFQKTEYDGGGGVSCGGNCVVNVAELEEGSESYTEFRGDLRANIASHKSVEALPAATGSTEHHRLRHAAHLRQRAERCGNVHLRTKRIVCDHGLPQRQTGDTICVQQFGKCGQMDGMTD